MNLGQVARLLAGFILFFTLSLLVPLAVAYGEDTELETARSFTIALVAGLAMAFVLRLAGGKSPPEFYRKESLIVVGLAWVLAGALAALPFQWSGAIPSPVDAFFEAISGLTTTGATVLGTNNVNIESLPQSILLWRSLLQWMGGIGIVLVFIVLVPGMGVTGSRLLTSEQIGVSQDDQRPRMRDQARRLFGLYIALTVAAGLGYWVVGMPAFDALCHAFTTIATAGFSTNDASIGGFANLGVELVAIVFMFLSGCNFLLLVRMLTRSGRSRPGSVVHAIEFRVFLGMTLVVVAGLTLSLWSWGGTVRDDAVGITRDYGNFGRCLRDAAFQGVAILTTTGYSSANYDNWPKTAVYLLLICMFVGGCTGSTAGGFKVLRLAVCAKLIGYNLRQFMRPRSVEKLRIGPDVIPNRIVSSILALLVLWLATVAAGTLVLDLDPRLDLVSAFAASLSMMGCIGPALSEALPIGNGQFELVGQIDLGPYGGYGELYPGAKLFMALQMILGRLEIVAPLVLLTPAFWKR